MVLNVGSANVRVNGINFRLGTAFVTGKGRVNIAIPSNAGMGTGLLDSSDVTMGQIIRLNENIENAGTEFPLFTLATGGTGTLNLIASNAMQGIRREASWTNGTVTAAITWLFNSTDAGFVAGRRNFVVGRVTAYDAETGEFTIGAGVRGTVTAPTAFTLPDNMETPIWNFPANRGTQSNPQTLIVNNRYRLNAAETRAANMSRTGSDPQAIYALVWHAPGDINDVLSVTFISDFNTGGHAAPSMAPLFSDVDVTFEEEVIAEEEIIEADIIEEEIIDEDYED